MIQYECYSEEGRNKELVHQFTYSFRCEPQAGDIIRTEEESWVVQGRYWKPDGISFLLIRKRGGRVEYA